MAACGSGIDNDPNAQICQLLDAEDLTVLAHEG